MKPLNPGEFFAFYRKCLASEKAKKRFAARALQQMATRASTEAKAREVADATELANSLRLQLVRERKAAEERVHEAQRSLSQVTGEMLQLQQAALREAFTAFRSSPSHCADTDTDTDTGSGRAVLRIPELGDGAR